MKAPFTYFGGKMSVVDEVWRRFGSVKHYIEPFCGSAAMLLGNPSPASLEVVNDANGFIANFWRSVVHQPVEVAAWCDYPVIHVEMGVRHRWLMAQRTRIEAGLLDIDWAGDAQVAGWWLWGQCAWIGSGWADGHKCVAPDGIGQIPHISNAGMGYQSIGQIPHIGNAGRGYLTSQGRAAHDILTKLCERMGRVRVLHGDWTRCLNHHYGDDSTAIFLDPPYDGFMALYGQHGTQIADIVKWCIDHQHLKIALCGHVGDYQLDGWTTWAWSRSRNTYGSAKNKDDECIWFSPACAKPETERNGSLF